MLMHARVHELLTFHLCTFTDMPEKQGKVPTLMRRNSENTSIHHVLRVLEEEHRVLLAESQQPDLSTQLRKASAKPTGNAGKGGKNTGQGHVGDSPSRHDDDGSDFVVLRERSLTPSEGKDSESLQWVLALHAPAYNHQHYHGSK